VADWNSYLQNLQIQTVDGTNSNGTDPGNSLSEAGFGSSVSGSDLSGDILAVTEIYYYPGNPSTFAPTDTIFSTAYAWNSYRGPLRSSSIDLRRVALHELGHFIGLDHPDQYGQSVNAIMNSAISNTDDLTAEDIAGGQYVYGARTPSSPGSTPAPAVTQVYRAGDFDGDRKADILWHDTTGGAWGVWYMDGTTVASTRTFNAGANYPVALFGDLDGGGQVDAVRWLPGTGALAISRGLGNLNFSVAYSTTVPTTWTLVGLADIK
jgi:hypothetical protein